jgi:hypothetical protein
MPYHEDFRVWFHDRLGMPVERREPAMGGDFRPWSPDEVARWAAEHADAPEERPYRNALSTADGGR